MAPDQASRVASRSGTCPACFGSFKLDRKSRMVLHGYTRPGGGWLAGKCPGVKYPPFQLSNEGTYAYIEQLKLTLAELEDYLQTLHDPMLVAFCDVLGHARTKAGMDEQWWARSLAELVKHKEWQAGGLTKNIDHLCTVAEAWVRAPLPGGST